MEQTTEYYPISNYLNNVTQQRQTVPVGYVTVCDPTFINETIIKLAATDEKFYFRQEKLTGMMHNQSACEFLLPEVELDRLAEFHVALEVWIAILTDLLLVHAIGAGHFV